MTEKIVGYFLLSIGMGIVLVSLVNGINLFTKNSQPIAFFKFDEIAITLPNLLDSQGTQINTSQKVMLPNTIEGPLNLAAHLFFLSFFVGIGAKVAGVGTNLVRPIIVKTKDEKTDYTIKT